MDASLAEPIRGRAIKLLLLFWLAILVYYGLRSAVVGYDPVKSFLRVGPGVLLGIAMSAPWVMLVEGLLGLSALLRWAIVIAYTVVGGFAFTILGDWSVISMDQLTNNRCSGSDCFAFAHSPSFAESLTASIFLFGCWILALLWAETTYRAKVGERREAAARDAAREAQLLALRYQVNPHFLFNCLNSLATLVNRGDREAASGMIREMSDFLRYGLASDPIADVELEDEIDMQRRYLEIERCRFSHRLTLQVEVADEVRQARVPSLILQPLVENAIKHGVASTSAPVTVRIRAGRHADGQVRIEVEDDAPSGSAPIRSFGIGLRNVAERLSTRFDGATALDARRLPRGGFRATVTLPLVRA